MIKRSHIENIRKDVKKAGDYKPTAEQIRAAILTVCPDGENVNDNKQAIVTEVVNLIQSSSQIEVISSTSTTTMLAETELESSEDAALTVAQKHDLIASVASQLDVTLSESEIVEVSTSLNNQINSRSEFITEIRNAIRSFIDTKADYQKQAINDLVSETIDYAVSKFRDNDQSLREGLKEINNFFCSDSAKFKKLSQAVTSAFKI